MVRLSLIKRILFLSGSFFVYVGNIENVQGTEDVHRKIPHAITSSMTNSVIMDTVVSADRIKAEFRNNSGLLHASKDKHIVAFLGNTGAGKSTLVNLLAGKELVVGDYGQDYVLAHPDDTSAMKIGTEGDSETFYPKSIQVGDLLYFDLPGFNDSDGSERNLVNAAFIRQILLEAASVRLVFVVGQDEFTAVRSNYVKKLFESIQQLFVVDTQSVDLINNSIFIATKSTCRDEDATLNFLLSKTSSANKSAFQSQLQMWIQSNRLFHIYNPILGLDNTLVKNRIIDIINKTQASKVLGINVSVLYPPETKLPLMSMFSEVMNYKLTNLLSLPLDTLQGYDNAIGLSLSKDFWNTFDRNLCDEDKSVGLLKEFCIDPYNDALITFEQANEIKRQQFIERLNINRQNRVFDIEKRTHQRAQVVIESFVTQGKSTDLVPFDYAYHKDFYDHVCGTKFINELATEPEEQEVVRQYYAGFISRHSHDQMLTWHRRFTKPQHDEQIATLTEQHYAQLAIITDNHDSHIMTISAGHASQINSLIQRLEVLEKNNIDEIKIKMDFQDFLKTFFDLPDWAYFSLDGYHLTKEMLSAVTIPHIASKCHSVISMTINGPIRDAGAHAIASSHSFKNLTCLNLLQNMMSDAGAMEIESSSNLTNLTGLYLIGSNISNVGALALISSTNLTNITILTLSSYNTNYNEMREKMRLDENGRSPTWRKDLDVNF